MNLPQFEQYYCRDILERADFLQQMNTAGIFHFDDTVDGEHVITTKNGQIVPIEDIITMSFQDFCQAYPGQDTAEACQNYLQAYTIAYGEDAVYAYERGLQTDREQRKVYAGLLAGIHTEG